MNNEQKFQVGDICDLAGMRVVVEGIETGTYPIHVESTLNSDIDFWLTLDGRALKNSEVVLKLIERPNNNKVMKRYWIWDVQSKATGRHFKNESYTDDIGLYTNGDTCTYTLIKKHESEFIDIEVEE